MSERRAAARRRGMSLIEVLIGMSMMALVIVGILQMFSLSLLMNFGAGARTELTAKCQQVVENLRVARFLQKQGNAALALACGLPDPFNVGSISNPVMLPYDSSSVSSSYWGPAQANVIEAGEQAYRLSYTVTTNPDPSAPAGYYLVTVTATAVNNPSVTGGQASTGGSTPSRLYLGMSKLKRVDYVAYIN